MELKSEVVGIRFYNHVAAEDALYRRVAYNGNAGRREGIDNCSGLEAGGESLRHNHFADGDRSAALVGECEHHTQLLARSAHIYSRTTDKVGGSVAHSVGDSRSGSERHHSDCTRSTVVAGDAFVDAELYAIGGGGRIVGNI